MALEYQRANGQLVWVRNPFTGVVTYFTDLWKKGSGFPKAESRPAAPAEILRRAEDERMAELETARRHCPFCPANEHMTTSEILRVVPETVPGCAMNVPWLIRAFGNITPRIPESCTGGRNESYVVVEDPRHFAEDARNHDDFLCSALLSPPHFRALIETTVEIAQLARENPAVRAVLIRKNQGRESGASQPHVHTQVIGGDRVFRPVEIESDCVHAEPDLWNEILRFADGEGYVIERRGDCTLYFCPFGQFPRSYEVVCPTFRQELTMAPTPLVEDFAALLHRALRILGPLPLDYEVHDGPGLPLHAHVTARHFPYSNIGGTLNLPAGIAPAVWHLSPLDKPLSPPKNG